jgi:RNA polymerase-binding transcription factor DksA
VAAAERNFQHILEAARSVSTDDEHDPEGVGLAVERAHVSASLAGARAYVSELEHALERVAAGTYGACETCGRPIGADRLLARPATRACIDCARTGAK